MFGDLFNNVNLVQKSMDAAWLRSEVIANNISNVSTPNFKASKVEFENYLVNAMASNGTLMAKKTNSKHIDFGPSQHHLGPAVVTDYSSTIRMDGNNVDINVQNSEYAKNAIYYQTLSTKISKELARIKLSISEIT